MNPQRSLFFGWLFLLWASSASLTPQLAAQQKPANPAPAAGDGAAAGVQPAGVQPAVGQPQQSAFRPNPFPDDGRNTWFEKTKAHLGTYYQEEFAVGSFKFKNPTKQEQQLSNMVGSCQCARAVIHVGDRTYSLGSDPVPNSVHRVTKDVKGNEQRERVTQIVVEPEQEGSIEVFMQMAAHTGEKEASLDFQTSDAELPHIKLQWRALGATYFVITPPDVNLNEMKWSEKRDFSFEISSPLKEDFEITGHEPLPEKMTIETKKEMRDGRAVWKVTGTYGPNVDEKAGGGTLTFDTNVEGKKATARVIAFVKGPMEIEPGGFVSLGYIRTGTSASSTIKIRPTDDFDLQIEQLEVEGLTVPKGHEDQLSITHTKVGKEVQVTIKVLEGMPRAVVRGTLKIRLNHPTSSTKEIMFNGFIR